MLPKLIFILKEYPKVSETFIAQEILRFQEAGFELDILSLNRPRDSQVQEINDKIKAEVQVLPPATVSSLFLIPRIIFSRRGVRLIQAIWLCLLDSLDKRSLGSSRLFLRAIHWSNQLSFKSSKIEFRSHFLHDPTQFVSYLSILTGIPFTASAHAKDIYVEKPKVLSRRMKLAKFVTTCTKYNHRYLKRIMDDQGAPIHFIPHGVDCTYFKPSSSKLQRSVSSLRFLSVGRLVEKKGYESILRALKLLKDRGVRFCYDVYGDGEQREFLKTLIEDLDLKCEVRLHGVVTHEEVLDSLQRGGVFLCHSEIIENGDRDGIPNSIAEAMAVGLPVVATSISGIPELIDHGISGVLVEDRSVEAYAEAILDLVESPEALEKLGEQARVKVESTFRQDNCFEELRSLF